MKKTFVLVLLCLSQFAVPFSLWAEPDYQDFTEIFFETRQILPKYRVDLSIAFCTIDTYVGAAHSLSLFFPVLKPQKGYIIALFKDPKGIGTVLLNGAKTETTNVAHVQGKYFIYVSEDGKNRTSNKVVIAAGNKPGSGVFNLFITDSNLKPITPKDFRITYTVFPKPGLNITNATLPNGTAQIPLSGLFRVASIPNKDYRFVDIAKPKNGKILLKKPALQDYFVDKGTSIRLCSMVCGTFPEWMLKEMVFEAGPNFTSEPLSLTLLDSKGNTAEKAVVTVSRDGKK